jgi:hypothetical protein
MRTKGFALGSGVAVLLFMLALSPGVASAGSHRIRTKLGIDAEGIIYPDGGIDWLFGGFVNQKPFGFTCIGHRKVRIFRDEPNAPDTLIASGQSDGIFGLALIYWRHPDLSKVPGDYYAKTRRVKVHTRRHGTIRCSGARSSTLTISAPQLHPVGSRDAAAATITRRGAR